MLYAFKKDTCVFKNAHALPDDYLSKWYNLAEQSSYQTCIIYRRMNGGLILPNSLGEKIIILANSVLRDSGLLAL